tara:strand:- start:874 stop:1920 length:1047 start_codon:yes stop_codon:yes gene_type:complete
LNENLQPLVSIVVLNFNAKDFLIKCIDSIFQSQYKDFEVILVDNASEDDTYKICKENHPEINLIINQENLGYCGGNNVGIKNATGEFIIILNPDTLVDPNWINEFFKSYEKFGDAIYQPKFISMDNDKMLLSSGQMINLFGFGFSRGKGDLLANENEKLGKIGYASGTCMFLPLSVMKTLNYFDDFLFAYHDDLDLCWRAAMMNIPSYYVPESIVLHPREGYSFKWSNLKFFLMERNRIYCLLTHYSHKTIFKIFPSLILVDIGVFLFYLKKGMVFEKIKATCSIIKNFKKIKKKYNEIQITRELSDKKLIRNFHDEIQVPEWILNKESNIFFNQFLNKLSKFTRKFI